MVSRGGPTALLIGQVIRVFLASTVSSLSRRGTARTVTFAPLGRWTVVATTSVFPGRRLRASVAFQCLDALALLKDEGICLVKCFEQSSGHRIWDG